MTTTESQNILIHPSMTWRTRPDEQRFTCIEKLRTAVTRRMEEAWVHTVSSRDIRVIETENDLNVAIPGGDGNPHKIITLSHWSFDQLAGYAQAPAKYLRTLPSKLVEDNLTWGLQHQPIRDGLLILGRDDGKGNGELRAITSARYQRIWDAEVLDAIEPIIGSGTHWEVPKANYLVLNPEEAETATTALCTSDRYMFLFLVDQKNPIKVKGEQSPLFRGIIIRNSEVGASALGIKTFLYRSYCNNRTIFGLTDLNESRIRHVGRARERFTYDFSKFLRDYAEESPKNIEATIAEAQKYVPPRVADQGWESWLHGQGFTKEQARAAVLSTGVEEEEACSLWDIIQGITASAREIQFADDRVELETAAGRLMRYVQR